MGEQQTTGKEKLGFIPMAKVPTTVGAKLWEQHKKNAAALNAAREAVSASKDQVRTAIGKALKLDPNTIDFWANDERVVVIRRPKEKKPRASTLADLTAAG